jgi:histone deacetylase 1/2
MKEEFDALQRNQTWELVPRPPHANVITGKWVFKNKLLPDGTLERYKARWVVRGFHQRAGIDFIYTFAPSIKPSTIRTVLHLAVSRAWPVHQMTSPTPFSMDISRSRCTVSSPPGSLMLSTPIVCVCCHALFMG